MASFNIFGRRREQMREQARNAQPGDLIVRNAQILEMVRPWLPWVFIVAAAMLAICTAALAFGAPGEEAGSNIRSGAVSVIVGLVTLGVIHLLFLGSERSERRAAALLGDSAGSHGQTGGVPPTEGEGAETLDIGAGEEAENGESGGVPEMPPRPPSVQRAMERAVFMMQLGYRLVMFAGLCLVAGIIIGLRGIFGI